MQAISSWYWLLALYLAFNVLFILCLGGQKKLRAAAHGARALRRAAWPRDAATRP